jgi:hypothetical protein
VHPTVGDVPGDGGVGVAGAEVFEGGALGGVALADVLAEGVNGGVVASDQGFEPATRTDRAELAVIADGNDLGPGRVSGGEHGEQVVVVGHAGLVHHDHGAGIEGDPGAGEPPAQRRDGVGLDAGGFGEGAGGLPARGGTEHGVSVGLERSPDGLQHRGLP